MSMIRQQLYIPKDLNHRLSIVAKQQRKSKAEVIRDLLNEALDNQKPAMTAAEALMGLVELGKKLKIEAEPDFSSHIDDFLYGDDKK